MPGVPWAATTDQIATGTAAKTLLQVVAGPSRPLYIDQIGISFESIDLDGVPIEVRVAIQTTAGTMSALTPLKTDGRIATALDVTAQHTATLEPTTTSILDRFFVHPTSGFISILPLGREIVLEEGTRLGIIVVAAASVDAIARMAGTE